MSFFNLNVNSFQTENCTFSLPAAIRPIVRIWKSGPAGIPRGTAVSCCRKAVFPADAPTPGIQNRELSSPDVSGFSGEYPGSSSKEAGGAGIMDRLPSGINRGVTPSGGREPGRTAGVPSGSRGSRRDRRRADA